MNQDLNKQHCGLEQKLEKLSDSLQQNPALNLSENDLDQLANEILILNTSDTKQESKDLRTQIGKMNVSGRIKAAMFGDVNTRALLIRDPNRLIQSFVLKNPQITFQELVGFAGDPNTPKGILRQLSETSKWIKEYPLKQAICFNPKTPLDISMKWVRYLNAADLKKLSTSKSVPNTLIVVVRKRLMELEKR